MAEITKCPWETSPKTVEQMLNTAMLQLAWEKDNGKKAPYEWHAVFTTQLIGDITHRMIMLEQAVFGG